MAKTKRTLQNRINTYVYDHIWLKFLAEYGSTFVMTAFSAAIFAFGVAVFLKPVSVGDYQFVELISGGSSGLAQVFALVFDLCGIRIEGQENLIYSLFYILINLPLIFLAIFGVGKRFGIFTMLNVLLAFVFTNLFKGEFFDQIAIFIDQTGGLLGRALFAGLCTGLSSAVAFKCETSAGGFDIVSYFISLRKSTTAGKYSVIINATIIAAFTLITALSHNNTEITVEGTKYVISSWATACCIIFFSVIYLFSCMLVIDAINVRNKKVQIQIITNNNELPSVLLSNVPHGATIVNAKGAFSGQDRKIIYMVVSSLEAKKVVTIVRQYDKMSFVNVTPLTQVYGRFFVRPVK